MRTRTKARQRAVEAIFEAEQRSVAVEEILERNPDVNEYAISLAKTVWLNISRIDELIETYAKDWQLNRMPAVDRAIIRVAVGELLYEKEIETNVVIAEAIEIAKNLSTEESVKFINGVLSNLGNVRDTLSSW